MGGFVDGSMRSILLLRPDEIGIVRYGALLLWYAAQEGAQGGCVRVPRRGSELFAFRRHRARLRLDLPQPPWVLFCFGCGVTSFTFVLMPNRPVNAEMSHARKWQRASKKPTHPPPAKQAQEGVQGGCGRSRRRRAPSRLGLPLARPVKEAASHNADFIFHRAAAIGARTGPPQLLADWRQARPTPRLKLASLFPSRPLVVI